MTYEGMLAETLTITGHHGDAIEAYLARPIGAGPLPSMVVIHHGHGWDEWCKEVTLKFAYHGYAAITPNLDQRAGQGSPDDVAARVRGAGWFPDDQVIGDLDGALTFVRSQPYASGKVGVIGFCSGGRYAYLAACRLAGVDAAIDCWGGDVIVDDARRLTARRPVAPVDLTADIRAPLLGIFGNEDANPTPDQVDRTEAALKQLGKTYEFHRYAEAGHAFLVTERASYRPQQAADAWRKIFAFSTRHLASP